MKWKQLIYWRISRNQSFTSARTVMQRHLPLRVTLCVCVCVWKRHKFKSYFGLCCLLNHVWVLPSKTLTCKVHRIVSKYFLCYSPHMTSLYTRIPCVWTICLMCKWKIKSPSLNRRLCDIHSITFPVVVKYIFARGVWDGEHTEHTSPCSCSLFIFLVMKWHDKTDWGLSVLFI